MSAPPQSELFSAFVDAAGMVIAEIHCRRCAYDLRGLQFDGLCPECGTPVGHSISRDMLRYCDPEWVDKLALGSRFMLGSIIAVLLIILITMFGGVLFTYSGGGPAALEALITLGMFGALGAVCYGTWLHTTPDPDPAETANRNVLRRVVRLAVLAGVGVVGLGLLADELPLTYVLETLLMFVGMGLMLVSLMGFLAYFRYMAWLAQRVPDKRLAKSAYFLFWSMVAYVALEVVAMVMLAALAGSMLPTPAPPSMSPAPTTNPGSGAVVVTGANAAATMPAVPPPVTMPARGGFAYADGAIVFACGMTIAGLVLLILFVRWQYRMMRVFAVAAAAAREARYANTP